MYSKKNLPKLKETVTLVLQKILSLKLLSDIGFYELRLKAKYMASSLHRTAPMSFSSVNKTLY